MEGNRASIYIYFFVSFWFAVVLWIPTKNHISFTVITAGITVWIMAFGWLNIRHWLFFLPVLFVSLWWNCWCKFTCTYFSSIGDSFWGICCERKKSSWHAISTNSRLWLHFYCYHYCLTSSFISLLLFFFLHCLMQKISTYIGFVTHLLLSGRRGHDSSTKHLYTNVITSS